MSLLDALDAHTSLRPVRRVGGLPAEPMTLSDHDLAAWEKRTHATLRASLGGV